MGRVLLVVVFSCFLALGAKAPSKLPAFNILLTDGATIFNTANIPKGRAVAIVLFDPGCSHCRNFTKKLLEKMDDVENVDFYMVSPVHSMEDIREFSQDFHLSKYENVKVLGRDYEHFFNEYYDVREFPSIALYDKDKNLIKLFDGNATVSALYEYTH